MLIQMKPLHRRLLADDEMLVPTVEDVLLDTLINYRDTNEAQSTTTTD